MDSIRTRHAAAVAGRLMVVATVLLLLSAPAMAVPPTTTGSGGLTIDNNTTACPSASGFVKLDRPEYDVIQNAGIHLNIEPDFSICTQGNANLDTRCNSASQCVTAGICSRTCDAGPLHGSACSTVNDCFLFHCTGTSTKTCAGGPNGGNTCQHDSDCNVPSTCLTTKSCTAGTLSGDTCSNDNDCGTCALSLECDPASNSNANIAIQGHTGVACTENSDCGAGLSCDTGSRCEGGNNDGSSCTSAGDCTGGGSCQVVDLCQFSDPVSGTAGTTKLCQGGGDEGNTCTTDGDCSGGSCVTVGKIDACYTTRDTSCGDAQVVYCSRYLGNIANPANSSTRVTAILETTDAQGNELDSPAMCIPPSTCRNTVGSLCCGLSQGAYGAPNSIATSLGGDSTLNCSNTNLGFIPAGQCNNCEVFANDPNATTIGIHDTRAVTIGPPGGGNTLSFLMDLATLENYLPSGGTPGNFKPSIVQTDTHYYNGCGTATGQIPDCTNGGTSSKGEGGGALAGQSMACGLNSFLSDCTPPFGGSSSFTASGFDGFTLPAAGTLVCTKRAGEDEVLGTGDDICQAFLYPTCVAGKTVAQVKAAADKQLAGQANGLGCSASALTQALDNINNEFEGCGNVIDCGAVVSPGVFTCP